MQYNLLISNTYLHSFNLVLNKLKVSVNFNFKKLEDYNEKLVISKDVTQNTMVIYALARKNSVSHEASMEKMPKFITKYFRKTNFMIVYPNQIAPEKNEKYSYFG